MHIYLFYSNLIKAYVKRPEGRNMYFLKMHISWLESHVNELLLLLTGPCPSITCLQETFLKPSDNLNIRGYTMYNHIHQSGDRASGGSSVIVNNSIPQSQIHLNTNIRAVAVKVTLLKTILVCSIYLPPGDRFNIAELESAAPKAIHYHGRFK